MGHSLDQLGSGAFRACRSHPIQCYDAASRPARPASERFGRATMTCQKMDPL